MSPDPACALSAPNARSCGLKMLCWWDLVVGETCGCEDADWPGFLKIAARMTERF